MRVINKISTLGILCLESVGLSAVWLSFDSVLHCWYNYCVG